MMALSVQYVFGYGSLVGLRDGLVGAQSLRGPVNPALLRGYRRTWNVAMDNARSIPGYKRYLDPATGEPANGFVVFLNIVPDPDRCVNGALLAVSAAELAELDRRERNYQRIAVSAHRVAPVEGPAHRLEPVDATVWTYAGSRAAVQRFEIGRRTGRAMISRAYRDSVRRGFAALGDEAAGQFDAWTDPPPCPVVALERVPVPEAV